MWIQTSNGQWKNLNHFVTIKFCDAIIKKVDK
jgi:hypothetical protein